MRVTRHDFLKVGLGASGALLVGIRLPFASWSAQRSEQIFDPFVRIDRDGGVTITVPRPEMGQGVRTALAMIVAEELDAEWAQVRVEQAALDAKYGDQYSGGSDSVQFGWEPLRQAGARVRSLLVTAAARTWGVEPDTCETRAGQVIHPASNRLLGYGALAASATELPVPESAPLKDPSEYRIVGRPTPSVDAPAIVDGSIPFGLDFECPGMLYAVIERAPVFGGRITSLDARAARGVDGVRAVVDVPGERFDLPSNEPSIANGVAVLGDSLWAAMKGRDALEVDWQAGPAGNESDRDFWARCERGSRRPSPALIRDDGDATAALAAATNRVDAVYRTPFLDHAPMEPMNCVASVAAGRCELWVPTQNPAGARRIAARVSGLPPEAITVHPLRSGGGFGRRYYSDFVGEAVHLAKTVGSPVKVVWTREDDMRHGAYRPAGHYVLAGGVDGNGNIIAWRTHLVNASRNGYLRWGDDEADAGEIFDYNFPIGFIPNLRLEYTQIESIMPRGQWRAVEESSSFFVTESFLDELAHAAGRDPLDMRLTMLGEPREMPFYSRTYDTGRLRGVLELAASEAGFRSSTPNGSGRGIAASYANSSYVAHVVEVSVSASDDLTIHRVVSAVDCGRVINPSGAEAQVEGAVAYALSAALYGEVTLENGGVAQGNFDTHPVLRQHEMPPVEVHFVKSEAPPSGLGEPGLPPLAPALTNAIFDATGTRIRRLPIQGQRLRI